MSFRDEIFFGNRNKANFKAKLGRMDLNSFKSSIGDDIDLNVIDRAKSNFVDIQPVVINRFDNNIGKKGLFGLGKSSKNTTRIGNYNVEILGTNSDGLPVGLCDKIKIGNVKPYLISTKDYSIFNPSVVDIMYKCCATYNNNLEYVVNSCLGFIRDDHSDFTGNFAECMRANSYGQTFVLNGSDNIPYVYTILIFENVSGFKNVSCGLFVNLHDGKCYFYTDIREK